MLLLSVPHHVHAPARFMSIGAGFTPPAGLCRARFSFPHLAPLPVAAAVPFHFRHEGGASVSTAGHPRPQLQRVCTLPQSTRTLASFLHLALPLRGARLDSVRFHPHRSLSLPLACAADAAETFGNDASFFLTQSLGALYPASRLPPSTSNTLPPRSPHGTPPASSSRTLHRHDMLYLADPLQCPLWNFESIVTSQH